MLQGLICVKCLEQGLVQSKYPILLFLLVQEGKDSISGRKSSMCKDPASVQAGLVEGGQTRWGAEAWAMWCEMGPEAGRAGEQVRSLVVV